MHAKVVLLVEKSQDLPFPWHDMFRGHCVDILQNPAETDLWDAVDRLRAEILVIEACDDALRYAERIRFFSSSLPVVALPPHRVPSRDLLSAQHYR
jgi:hypothetical protein